MPPPAQLPVRWHCWFGYAGCRELGAAGGEMCRVQRSANHGGVGKLVVGLEGEHTRNAMEAALVEVRTESAREEGLLEGRTENEREEALMVAYRSEREGAQRADRRTRCGETSWLTIAMVSTGLSAGVDVRSWKLEGNRS